MVFPDITGRHCHSLSAPQVPVPATAPRDTLWRTRQRHLEPFAEARREMADVDEAILERDTGQRAIAGG